MMNVEYFINKFEAIPEEFWCTGKLFSEQGGACANGHCGVRPTGREISIKDKTYYEYSMTYESEQLEKVFSKCVVHSISGKMVGESTPYPGRYSNIAASINNGSTVEYRQATPKQRILAALRDIQSKEQQEKAVEQVQEILAQEAELV